MGTSTRVRHWFSVDSSCTPRSKANRSISTWKYYRRTLALAFSGCIPTRKIIGMYEDVTWFTWTWSGWGISAAESRTDSWATRAARQKTLHARERGKKRRNGHPRRRSGTSLVFAWIRRGKQCRPEKNVYIILK